MRWSRRARRPARDLGHRAGLRASPARRPRSPTPSSTTAPPSGRALGTGSTTSSSRPTRRSSRAASSRLAGSSTPRAGLGSGETYTSSVDVTLPQGIDGNYFLFVFADSATCRTRRTSPARTGGPAGSTAAPSTSRRSLSKQHEARHDRRALPGAGSGRLRPGRSAGRRCSPARPSPPRSPSPTRARAPRARTSGSIASTCPRDPSLDSTDLQVGGLLRFGALAVGG